MSEKTLNEVGQDAAKLYKDHKFYSEAKDRFKDHRKEIAEAKFRVNELESEKFASNNAEQLHDLAVIEAHLGGVAITVEQPLEIGQKVEVKTPAHQ